MPPHKNFQSKRWPLNRINDSTIERIQYSTELIQKYSQDSIDKRFDEFEEKLDKKTGSFGTKDSGKMRGSLWWQTANHPRLGKRDCQRK